MQCLLTVLIVRSIFTSYLVRNIRGEEHDDQGEGVGLGEVVSQSVSQLIQIFVNHLCRNLESSWVNNHHGPVQGYQ